MPIPDLAARTLELVDVPSESRHEDAAMGLVRGLLPGEPLYDDGDAIVWGDPAAPVVLAGHLDTVPAQGNLPGRIAGDVLIELSDLSARQDEIDRDRPVVFYCRTGARSGMATDAFRQAGYDARNLAGGLQQWAADGLALEPADGVVA